MIAVIFEVEPGVGQLNRYLEIASELRPLLSNIDGFISIERFQSLTDENRILSLSFWRDEDAIAKWRKIEQHRFAQSEGRSDVFKEYRIRVAEVTRDYSMSGRNQAPTDSAQYHNP